jgi:hypothetical protein
LASGVEKFGSKIREGTNWSPVKNKTKIHFDRLSQFATNCTQMFGVRKHSSKNSNERSPLAFKEAVRSSKIFIRLHENGTSLSLGFGTISG